MRILLISSPFVPTPPPTYGGTQRDVALLGEQLAGMGHEVTVVASKHSHVPGCRMVETIEWREGETFADVRGDRSRLMAGFWGPVLDHLRENRDYDVVNSHAWLSGMPYAEVRKCAKRLCVSIHGGGPGPQNNIFVSAAMRDRHRPTGRYIHNPVDPARYEYRETKEPYLSFVARIDPAKGIDMAIRVAKATGIPLRFGGNIVSQGYFRTQVQPHLNGHVQYVGQVGGKEKSALLGRSMAVLYPTRLAPEPFGRVPLEANACGTPAIAYNNGGLREVVRHGTTGFLAPGEKEMAEAVPHVAALSSRACRRWVEDNFAPRLIAERYLAAYEDLTNGRTWG